MFAPSKGCFEKQKWATKIKGCGKQNSLNSKGFLTAAGAPLGRLKGQSPRVSGVERVEGEGAFPGQSQGNSPQHLRLPRLPEVHNHILPELQPGEHEGSGRDQGFINRKRGGEGERRSALKIDLQALPRGPAPEIAREGAWGAQSTSRKGGRVNGAPACLKDQVHTGSSHPRLQSSLQLLKPQSLLLPETDQINKH